MLFSKPFRMENCCDGIYNSFDVHFTSACDNKCEHCIDRRFPGLGIQKPDVDSIVKTIVENQDGYDDVLFLGGEPCLFLEELVECCARIRCHTHLKVFVTTAVPAVCYEKYDLFVRLLHIVDGINLSVQHHDEATACLIRGKLSSYDRQEFYRNLPLKEKIRINLNIVWPYLYTRRDLEACLTHYDVMGFNSIKLSEIQHGKTHFRSFEKIFGIKLGSPYAEGCQTYLDMDELIPGFKTPVLLKRSCFACEETLKASFADGLKVLYKAVTRKGKGKYGVVYENGTLTRGWI